MFSTGIKLSQCKKNPLYTVSHSVSLVRHLLIFYTVTLFSFKEEGECRTKSKVVTFVVFEKVKLSYPFYQLIIIHGRQSLACVSSMLTEAHHRGTGFMVWFGFFYKNPPT
jgi:hypothetical protein